MSFLKIPLSYSHGQLDVIPDPVAAYGEYIRLYLTSSLHPPEKANKDPFLDFGAGVDVFSLGLTGKIIRNIVDQFNRDHLGGLRLLYESRNQSGQGLSFLLKVGNARYDINLRQKDLW